MKQTVKQNTEKNCVRGTNVTHNQTEHRENSALGTNVANN